MDSNTFADKSMWDYLAQGMIKEWPGLQPAQSNVFFQFSGKPIPANWGDGTTYDGWTVANTVPADLEGYYTASTDLVARAYKDYITSIAPTDFQTNNQYKQYQVELNAFIVENQTISSDAVNAYKTWKARYPDVAGTTTYFNWLGLAGTDGPAWNAKLENNLKQQTVTQKSIAAFMKSVNAPLANAQAEINDASNLEKFSVAGVSQEGLLTTIADITSSVANWSTRTPTDPCDLNITINKNTVEAGSWNKVVKTSVKKKCFSISTKTTVDYKRILLDTNFEINVSAVGANTFAIARGSWFDATWLNASNVKLPEGSRFTKDDFFGVKGALHMVPTSALVIYKPKVTITVSSQTYTQTIKKWFDASATVSFFGTDYSLSAGESSIVKDGPKNTKIITLNSYNDADAQPLLFGMASQSFYQAQTEENENHLEEKSLEMVD